MLLLMIEPTASCIVIGIFVVLILLWLLKSPNKARLEHFLAETQADLKDLEKVLYTQEETITELKRVNGLNRNSIKKLREDMIEKDRKHKVQSDIVSLLQDDDKANESEIASLKDKLINRDFEIIEQQKQIKETDDKARLNEETYNASLAEADKNLNRDMIVIKEHVDRIAQLEGELAKMKSVKKPRKPYTRKKK